MNRSHRYSKQTKTLGYKGYQKSDTEICEIDVLQDSNDSIMSQHNLREVHVVLRRLRVLPDGGTKQNCEAGLSNLKDGLSKTKNALQVTSADQEPKLRARSSPRLSKQINRNDITIQTTVLSRSASSPPTSDLKNKRNNSLSGTPQATEASDSFPTSRSPNGKYEKRNTSRDNGEKVVFSADKPLKKSKTLKSKLASSISENALKEQVGQCPISSEKKEILVQSKSNPKKSKKSSENIPALPNKDLPELLPKKSEINDNDANKTYSRPKTRSCLRQMKQPNTYHVVPVAEEKEAIQNKNTKSFSECDTADIQSLDNEELHAKSTLGYLKACPLGASEDFRDVDNISSKNLTNNEKIKSDLHNSAIAQNKEIAEQKDGKDDNPPVRIQGCGVLVTIDANSSQNQELTDVDAKGEVRILSEEEHKSKQVELSSGIGEFASESTCPPLLQSSNFQLENQDQSSVSTEQESPQFKSDNSNDNFSTKKEHARKSQVSLSSISSNAVAVPEKERPCNKTEGGVFEKTHALQIEKSEADSFNGNDVKFSSTELSLDGSISSSKCTVTTSDNEHGNASFSNSGKEVTSNENNEFSLSSVEVGYSRKRRSSRDLASSTTKQKLASRRRGCTLHDSSNDLNINSSLEEIQIKDRKFPKDPQSAIVKGKKRKIVTDMAPSTTKPNLASTSDFSNDGSINSSVEEIQSKDQKLSTDSDTTIVKGKKKKKKIVKNRSSTTTNQKFASDKQVAISSGSSDDIFINSSIKNNQCKGQKLSKDSKPVIIKGKKRKIVTEMTLSTTKPNLAPTSSEAHNDCKRSSLLEEIQGNGEKVLNDPQSTTVKRKKKKIVTNIPSSTTKSNFASTLSDADNDYKINSSLDDIHDKGEADSKDSQSTIVKRKKKKIVSNIPSSTTKSNLASTSSNVRNDYNINSSFEEIPSKSQETSEESQSAIVEERKKKIALDMSPSTTKPDLASTSSNILNECNINSSLEEIPSKSQELPKESQSAVVEERKKKIAIDMSSPATKPDLASTSSNILNNCNINSSLEEIPSKSLELSKESQFTVVEERKKKIVPNMSSSTTKPDPASTSSNILNDFNINSSLEEVPSKSQELSKESQSAVVEERKKKIATDIASSTTRPDLASTSSYARNACNINSSLEENQSQGQELSKDAQSAIVEERKMKIVTDMSSTLTTLKLEDKQIAISYDSSDAFNINSSFEKFQIIDQKLSKDSDSSDEEEIDSQYSFDSSNIVTNDLSTEIETSASGNKNSPSTKKNKTKRKCADKKERKKLKIIDTLEYERSTVSNSKDKLSENILESKCPKLPEIQFNKQSSIDSCDSSVDSFSLEKCQNQPLSLPHSTDIDAITNRNIESETHNSVESSSKVTSENSNNLKEDNTSIHVYQVMEKSDTGNFSGDTNISSSSLNNPVDSESGQLLSSDLQSKPSVSCEDSLKAFSPDLGVSNKQNLDTISSNALKSDLPHECTNDPTTADIPNKEFPSSSFIESINLQSAETSKVLNETVNKNGDLATSLSGAIESSGLPMKQEPGKLRELVTQGEEASSNTLPAEIAETPLKIDLSLCVSNALKSTKLSSMPSHKAKMANYLLKQLALDQSSPKQDNEINSNFSHINLSKIEKAKSEPTLCLTYDLCIEDDFEKKNNEDLSIKPEYVQKVTSSTSIKGNIGEHTFKIPNKAAPKAKKKSACTKSNTFLKPKTNENNIFLQRMISSFKGRAKYTKLFLSGSVSRRITTSHLLKSIANRNEKKIPIPNVHSGQTSVQNPTLPRALIKGISQFKQTSSNKTIETIQGTTSQLKNLSSVHNTNKSSHLYILKEKEQTGTEINCNATNALYLSRSVKKESRDHYKQDNEIISGHNLQESNIPGDQDKSVTTEKVNNCSTSKLLNHHKVKSLESSSSSEIVSNLITNNKSENKMYHITSQTRCATRCINKDKENPTKQIPEGTNSESSSAPESSENTKEKKENNQDNQDTKNNSTKVSSFKGPERSDTWHHLKKSCGHQVAEQVFCLEKSKVDRLSRSGTNAVNTSHTVSDDSSPRNDKNSVLKKTRKNVNSISNEHEGVRSKPLQSDDSEQNFQNNVSNEKYKSKLKNATDHSNDDSTNLNSSKLNVPLKQLSENSLSMSSENSPSDTQIKPIPRKPTVRERLSTSESSVLPQDTSSNRSNLAAQVCELVSELRNLDNTTTVALNNYKKSINNEEVNQELKAMIPREGLSLKSHPDRPPEWFLKFIASFRKQELWRLHQMFKIHDHLMRIESAKLNVLEKVYEELKEKEGIKNDST